MYPADVSDIEDYNNIDVMWASSEGVVSAGGDNTSSGESVASVGFVELDTSGDVRIIDVVKSMIPSNE